MILPLSTGTGTLSGGKCSCSAGPMLEREKNKDLFKPESSPPTGLARRCEKRGRSQWRSLSDTHACTLICMCSHYRFKTMEARMEVTVDGNAGRHSCVQLSVWVVGAGWDFRPVQLSQKSNWSAAGSYALLSLGRPLEHVEINWNALTETLAQNGIWNVPVTRVHVIQQPVLSRLVRFQRIWSHFCNCTLCLFYVCILIGHDDQRELIHVLLRCWVCTETV